MSEQFGHTYQTKLPYAEYITLFLNVCVAIILNEDIRKICPCACRQMNLFSSGSKLKYHAVRKEELEFLRNVLFIVVLPIFHEFSTKNLGE